MRVRKCSSAVCRNRATPGCARADRIIEALEPRTLLNATLSAAIGPVNLSAGAAPSTVDLNAHFTDPNVPGTAVKMQSTQGTFYLGLSDQQTPLTVANFLKYVNAGRYNTSVFHRAVVTPSPFILQGGGYYPDQSTIPSFGAVKGEPGISNTTGTIAMALSTGPDSATSQWFVNLTDNSFLDSASSGGPFTVFGQVIYGGMTVVNAIANLPKGKVPPNFEPITQAGDDPNGVLPLQNYTQGNPIVPANYVTLPSVTVVPKLAFGASSDSPSVVSASIGANGLVLTPGFSTGTATITVAATDLGGNVATATFPVIVAPGTQVKLGAGSARIVRFVPSGGGAGQISVTGPGSATLSFAGTGLTQTTKHGIVTISGAEQGVAVATTGTTGASTLNLTGRGALTLSGVTADGSLRAINAPGATLTGTIAVAGSIGGITLAADKGTITAASIGKLSVRGAMDGAVTTTTGNIGSITTGSMVDNSHVYAGIGALAGGQMLPLTATDFAGAAAIGAVHIGRGGFAGSDIAAQTLGTLSLGTIRAGNSGTPFGVAGHTIRNLTGTVGTKHLHLAHVASESDVTAALSKQGIVLQDLVIRII